MQKITFDFKTGTDIRLSVYNQMNLELGFMMMKMAAGVMPKLTQQWFQTISKFLIDSQPASQGVEKSKSTNQPIVQNAIPEDSESDKK